MSGKNELARHEDGSMKACQEIVEFIAATIEDVSLGEKKAATITPDSRLMLDLGLDSLDYATVLLSCEEWLGIKVREENVDWRALDTVERLAGFLHDQQRA